MYSRKILTGLAIALSLGIPGAALADAPPPLPVWPRHLSIAVVPSPLTKAQQARFDALRAVRDKIDKYGDTAAYAKAAQAALDYAVSVFPPDHPLIEVARGEVLLARHFTGNLDGVVPALERSVAIFERAGPAYTEELISTLNNLAVVSDTTGNPDKSPAILERAIKVYRDAMPGVKSRELGLFLGNLAWSHRKLGHYDLALRYSQDGVAMLEALHQQRPDDHILGDGLVSGLSNQVMILSDLGRKDEAVGSLSRLISRLDELAGKDSVSTPFVLQNSAIYLMNEGRFPEAEANLRRAIAIRERLLGPEAGETATTYSALIALLYTQARYNEALPLAEHIAPILERTRGAAADETVETRAKLARLAFVMGDPARGIAMMQSIVEGLEKRLPPNHRELLANRESLATMLGRSGQWAEAENQLALLVAARGPAKTVDHAATDAMRARGEARLGRTADALARLKPATAALASALDQEIRSQASRGARYGAINRGIGLATLAALDAGDFSRGLDLAQLYGLGPSDRALLRARQRERTTNPATKAQLSRLQDLTEERGAAQSAFEAATAAGDAVAIRDAKTKIDALSAQIDPLLAADKSDLFDSLSLATLQSRLGRDEAVLIPIETDGETRILLVTASQAFSDISPLATGNIVSLVKTLRDRIAEATADPAPTFATTETDALYRAIFTPAVERQLMGKRVIHVIARGSLGQVPFAMLTRVDNQGRREWAIERHAFDYPMVLARIGATAGRSINQTPYRSFIGVGAPDLPAQSDGQTLAFRGAMNQTKIANLGRLDFATSELKAIARAVSAVNEQILTGTNATEPKVRAAGLAEADLLTFATHGLVAGELDALTEAALVLSPSIEDSNGASSAADGLLTASEISSLRLSARMVVLSACNSAGGDRVGGEALSGLARAFLYAGAQSLLVSHWPLRDDTAARLSVATIKAKATGASGAEALRKAQLALMRDRSIEGSANPVLWAPFVMVGN